MERKANKPPHTTGKKPVAHLLGVGLDHKDGHKRITQSERFMIVGGSEETHGRMTETVLKTFETLDRKGKALADVEKEELAEIIDESTPN
ncbi:MAG: hypothetical protein ACPGSB_05840 [Opitutales bacterium]